MTPEEKAKVLEAAAIMARYDHPLLWWDSWRGFGGKIRVDEKNLEELCHELKANQPK